MFALVIDVSLLDFWRAHLARREIFASVSMDRSDKNHIQPYVRTRRYRPTPEPGAGVTGDPLGEVLIAGFPDGFRALFAPAAALPASLLKPVVELPVVVLLTDGPVVVPLVVDPPVAVLPPVEPVPVCASAKLLASASTAANPSVPNFASFMVSFLSRYERKTVAPGYVSGAGINWV
ncbi:hypothetical protein [Bradyrhizobium sp. AUGA SZCCT0182]|uniref:hypothetical protein n=1 Tax=Bradyrhizobium sp. AUGA SZCCT0182 TaxID=2807667 RepID=UPI001BA69EA0|nr:hypothetical protein [Bradyrhizobium sp. AUGA SZCCT0182]MBR1231064.1 hypothetical protein [Bradyrhizobium sp. AUGA SZCCT0182]